MAGEVDKPGGDPHPEPEHDDPNATGGDHPGGSGGRTDPNTDRINHEATRVDVPATDNAQGLANANNDWINKFGADVGRTELKVDNSAVVLKRFVMEQPFTRLAYPKAFGPNGVIRGIEPGDLKDLVEDKHDDLMIIDLRSLEDTTNQPENKYEITGARHVPMTAMAERKPMTLNYKDLAPSEGVTEGDLYTKASTTWAKLRALKQLPLEESTTKKYVVFHCAYGKERSPLFAAGYAQFMAKPNQTIIVLNRGFGAYHESYNAIEQPWNGLGAIKANLPQPEHAGDPGALYDDNELVD